MLRVTVLALILCRGVATTAVDQAPPPPGPPPFEQLGPQPGQAPQPPVQRPPEKPPLPLPTPVGPPPVEPPAPGPVRKLRGRDANLQIEITISDQLGGEAPQKKVVSMLVADQTMGRIRASANAQRDKVGFVGTGLNVDARPVVTDRKMTLDVRATVAK
jgi:hypothetical protein